MSVKMILPVVIALGLAGCATARESADLKKLQYRVVDLEKKVEDKDREIIDLQYEVKDLASQLNSDTPSTSYATRDLMEPTPTAASRTTVTADYSAKNEEIVRVDVPADQVQLALKNAGYYKGAIDSKIGPGTQKAIQDFQRGHNLKADGIVGKGTWTELQRYLK